MLNTYIHLYEAHIHLTHAYTHTCKGIYGLLQCTCSAISRTLSGSVTGEHCCPVPEWLPGSRTGCPVRELDKHVTQGVGARTRNVLISLVNCPIIVLCVDYLKTFVSVYVSSVWFNGSKVDQLIQSTKEAV